MNHPPSSLPSAPAWTPLAPLCQVVHRFCHLIYFITHDFIRQAAYASFNQSLTLRWSSTVGWCVNDEQVAGRFRWNGSIGLPNSGVVLSNYGVVFVKF
jgi:hypothetical protein